MAPSWCLVPSSLGSAVLEVLLPKEGHFPRGHSTGQFKVEVKTVGCLVGALLAPEPTGQGFPVLDMWVIWIIRICHNGSGEAVP